MTRAIDPERPNEVSFPELLGRQEHEISRAYQIVYDLVERYESVCARAKNPMGEKYLLTPQLDVFAQGEHAISVEVPRDEGYHYTRGEALAQVQFGIPYNGRKLARNAPYFLIIDGNITNPLFSFNPNGEFLRIREGDEVQFSYMSDIEKIADASLSAAQKLRKERRGSKIAKGALLVGLSAIGAGGWGVYDHYHDKNVAQKAAKAEFDQENPFLTGTELRKGGLNASQVVTLGGIAVPFAEIPNLESGEWPSLPRRLSVTAGSCRWIAESLNEGSVFVVGKAPGVEADMTAIIEPDGDAFVCAPGTETFEDSDGDTQTARYDVAVQIRAQG